MTPEDRCKDSPSWRGGLAIDELESLKRRPEHPLTAQRRNVPTDNEHPLLLGIVRPTNVRMWRIADIVSAETAPSACELDENDGRHRVRASYFLFDLTQLSRSDQAAPRSRSAPMTNCSWDHVIKAVSLAMRSDDRKWRIFAIGRTVAMGLITALSPWAESAICGSSLQTWDAAPKPSDSG